jgi:uncharacterized membrane protein
MKIFFEIILIIITSFSFMQMQSFCIIKGDEEYLTSRRKQKRMNLSIHAFLFSSSFYSAAAAFTSSPLFNL